MAIPSKWYKLCTLVSSLVTMINIRLAASALSDFHKKDEIILVFSPALSISGHYLKLLFKLKMGKQCSSITKFINHL